MLELINNSLIQKRRKSRNPTCVEPINRMVYSEEAQASFIAAFTFDSVAGSMRSILCALFACLPILAIRASSFSALASNLQDNPISAQANFFAMVSTNTNPTSRHLRLSVFYETSIKVD